MSLTFTLPCADLDSAAVITPHTDAVIVGSELEGPFKDTPTHLGTRGVTTRPIEAWTADGLLHIRLPTNAACKETSQLGIAVMAAAARASGVEITDEEQRTFAVEAFLEEYDENWCLEHMKFGLHAMASIVDQHKSGWAIMPTFHGNLTFRPQRLAEGPMSAKQTIARFRRRAWIMDEVPASTIETMLLGTSTDSEHRARIQRVVIGQAFWIDHSVCWVAVEGIDGLLPVMELIDAFGQHAELVDDGCVVLPELDPEEAERVHTAADVHARNDPSLLLPHPRLTPSDPTRLLGDLELVPAAMAIVHPQHARELVAARRPSPAERLEHWTVASALCLPKSVRRMLALAPVRLALMVAAADGKVDIRERFAVFRSGSGLPEGPLKVLWESAFPDKDSGWQAAREEDPAAGLIQAIELATHHLAPPARKIWGDAMMERGQATAEASGGFLGFFGNRVSDEEADVLKSFHSMLDQALRMP